MPDALRIVHCFRSPVGGIFRHVRDLTEAQAAAGHQVGIVCDSSTGGAFEDTLFETMAPKLALGIFRTPMQRNIGPGDIASAWRTYRIIKALQPDVLHGHGAKGGVYARAFGSLLRVSRSRVARLYSPHGGSLHYDGDSLKGRTLFAIERLLERATDEVLFVCDYERRAFEHKIDLGRAPYAIVYNGLRDEEFEPVAPAPDTADFLYIGMMRDLKGPDLFIDALKEVERASGRLVTAVMVGAGDDLPKYHAQAERLGLSTRIRFLAPMPARAAFALGRTVVLPSRAEAMPYIVLEALAAGKTMVATAVGGVPEIFGAGSPVLVAADAEQIATRMHDALANPDGFAALMPSQAGLRAVFSASAMAAQIEAAYRRGLAQARLISKGREPPP